MPALVQRLTANAAKYSGCTRCRAGACAALSPTTMPPLATANAANAAGTAASGHRQRSSRPRSCGCYFTAASEPGTMHCW
jgi:hypothetical protein